MRSNTPTVLVVDDDRELADLYTGWLAEQWDVRTAYGGNEAIELLSSEIDVALLDRRMPETRGEDLLEYIRDRSYDVRIGMVTAVIPDIDIVEMGFDAYVVKPVDKDELQSLVESLYRRSRYDEQLQNYYSLVSKRASLESTHAPRELQPVDEYHQLIEQINELEAEIDQTIESLSPNDFDIELRRMIAD